MRNEDSCRQGEHSSTVKCTKNQDIRAFFKTTHTPNLAKRMFRCEGCQQCMLGIEAYKKHKKVCEKVHCKICKKNILEFTKLSQAYA